MFPMVLEEIPAPVLGSALMTSAVILYYPSVLVSRLVCGHLG